MAYPPITPLSTPPSRDQTQAAFTAAANIFHSELPGFANEMNTLASWMEDTASAVEADAANAAASAVSASESSSAAIAVSEYKGPWSSLTGALNIPASSSHDGIIWILAENVADVTAVEPGVSDKWIATATGDVVLATSSLYSYENLG